MGDESAERFFQLLALDDHVDHAMLKKKFRPLKLIGQLLLDRLLDDTGTGEPDQRLRLRDVQVAERAERGDRAARGRIGQHADEGAATQLVR